MDIFSYLLGRKYKDSNTGSGSGANITSNIKIVDNKSSVLSSNHNKLCIVNDTSDLSFKVSNKFIKDSLEFQSNSNGHKITINNAYYNYYNNAMVDYNAYYGYFGWIATFCEDINKIFVAYSNDNRGLGTKCYLYDISTNSWEEIYNASDDSSFTKQSFYYKNKIYCKTNKAFNLETKQMEDTNFNINISGKIYSAGNRAIVSGNLIYYVNSSKLTIYDVESDTINELALTKSINSYPAYSYARCIYGDYIYICGTTWYNQPQNKFFKINIHNGEVSNLTEIPISMDKACGCNIGNKFYVSQAGTNKIYIFNLDTETWEDNTLTNLGANANAVGEILTDGNKLFFINNITDSCYVVTYNFTGGTLPTNEVYIYTSNGSKFNFDLITDQVTIPIKNVYIGDSTNTAQLANAYLYDDSQSSWVNVNTGEVLN